MLADVNARRRGDEGEMKKQLLGTRLNELRKSRFENIGDLDIDSASFHLYCVTEGHGAQTIETVIKSLEQAVRHYSNYAPQMPLHAKAAQMAIDELRAANWDSAPVRGLWSDTTAADIDAARELARAEEKAVNERRAAYLAQHPVVVI